jgi:hypothetical protein
VSAMVRTFAEFISIGLFLAMLATWSIILGGH